MITKRGKLWYSDFEVHGKRVRRSLRTTNEAEARAKSQALFSKLSASGNVTDSVTTEVTVKDVIDYTYKHKWSKMKDRKKKGLCELTKELVGPDLPLSEVGKKTLRALQEKVVERGNKPATANRYLNCLTGAIRFYYDHQDLEAPTPSVKRYREPETKVVWLTNEQMEAILAAEPDFRMRTFWQSQMEIGARCGDGRSMVWEDFDWENGTYTVGNGKVDKPQAVPLNKSLLDAFQVLKQRGYPRPFQYTENDIRVAFRRVKKKAGITDPRITPNTMRHTCATHLLAAGADVKEVQMWMGHSKITTTQRYMQVMPQRLMRLRNSGKEVA